MQITLAQRARDAVAVVDEGGGGGRTKELAEDFVGGSGAASGDDGFALETNKHGSVNHRFEPY